jgi:Flp pilus assembly pilin Flp
MANALGLIGKIFMQIGVAAGPIAERMLADFVGWLDRISESLSNPEGIKGLMGFFQEMYPIFKALIGLVADFGGGIVDVGRQNAPELLNFIKWLGEFGAVFVKWINETVDKYGPMLARWFKIIGNLIGILWDAATKIYDALEPVIDFLTRLIELAIAAWRAFTRFLEVTHILDLIKVALAVIMWPLNLMLEILTQVFRWVESLFTKLADSKYGRAATEVWGQIAGAISNVAGVVQTVIDALKTAWEWMQKLNPGSWFGGQDELTVDAVNSNPTALMAARNGQVPPNMRYDPTTNRVVAAGASGAIVTRPTKALIGESGPEAVVPLSAARGARRLRLDSEGGGKSIQIGAVHVHGVQNLDQFVNEVQKYVANLPRESGSQMSIG